jgi:cytochrome b561
MSNLNPPRQYSSVAITLHWLIALAIICNLGIGLFIVEAGARNPAKATPAISGFFKLHLLLGLAVLILSVFRLAWRLSHRVPELPPMNPLLRVAAHVTHVALYVGMIAVPVVGLLMILIGRGYVPVTGLPDIAYSTTKVQAFMPHGDPRVMRAVAVCMDAHMWLAFSMAGLLVLHVGAALLHHFWYRDDVVRRMLPAMLLRRPSAAGRVEVALAGHSPPRSREST